MQVGKGRTRPAESHAEGQQGRPRWAVPRQHKRTEDCREARGGVRNRRRATQTDTRRDRSSASGLRTGLSSGGGGTQG